MVLALRPGSMPSLDCSSCDGLSINSANVSVSSGAAYTLFRCNLKRKVSFKTACGRGAPDKRNIQGMNGALKHVAAYVLAD